jgi:arabinofuranosyltransferase
MSVFRGGTEPIFVWVDYGKQAKAQGLTYSKFPNIGFYGYYAGRQCFILDELALCDPLLARLPAIKPWRIGHFKREIPKGYEETLQSGINKIEDTNLAKYYDKILLITRGDLFSSERLKAIWKINTGQYGYLIDKYNDSIKGNSKPDKK